MKRDWAEHKCYVEALSHNDMMHVYQVASLKNKGLVTKVRTYLQYMIKHHKI